MMTERPASADPGADDLELLIRSRYPVIAVDTFEEQRLTGLLGRVAERLAVPLFLWSRTEGLSRLDGSGSVYETSEPEKVLRHMQVADTDGLYLLADFQPYLEDPIVARRFRETAERFTGDRRAILLSGLGISLPAELKRLSIPFQFKLPDDDEIRQELRYLIGDFQVSGRLTVDLTRADADRLVEHLRGLSLAEIRRAIQRAALDDGRLDGNDLEKFLRIKQETLGGSGLLEFHAPAPETPVGGMRNLQDWLEKRRAALSAEARAFGLDPPKGILLLGVQGCGKSLLARSVSTAWGLPLIRLDPGALFDKFIGETEKNLRRALDAVDAMTPAILWIDEVEKAFASSGEDGGVSTRVLGSFLTWFQERPPGIFVVATANAIDSLPPEFLRKGRFDEIFFVDLPEEADRAEILSLHLNRRDRAPATFDIAGLARASEGFSGAELEQAIVAGLYTAFAAGTDLTDGILLSEIDAAVPLSVTMAEKVDALRRWAQGRAVPAG